MIDNFYDKVVVKTVYRGNNKGSGVLLQTENSNYSYLITGWHCLNQEKVFDLNLLVLFQQIEGNMRKLTVSPQESLVISETDIVIIKLSYISDIPKCNTTTISVGDMVSIAGFPRALYSDLSKIKRFPLNARIVSLPGMSVIELGSERSLDTFTQDAIEVMSGFSGSGIFKKSDNEIFLCGIITELSSPDGAFDTLCGVSIDCIQKKLIEKSWDPLCDIEVSSFNLFKKDVIEIFEDPMNRICSLQMPNIRTNVVPNDIIKRCGKKLVWPYSDKSLQCKEIWEGWLLYLIFRSIENQENLKSKSFYSVNNGNVNRKVKFIYVTNKTTLSEFLKDYLQNAYKDISEGDFLIIKTKREPATVMLQSAQIRKVVTNISSAICVEQEIRIDDVHSSIKKISLIHIRKMIDELNLVLEANEETGIVESELERLLGKRIGEMLHEF